MKAIITHTETNVWRLMQASNFIQRCVNLVCAYPKAQVQVIVKITDSKHTIYSQNLNSDFDLDKLRGTFLSLTDTRNYNYMKKPLTCKVEVRP